MKTTLIFIRHGQSLGNATRHLLGHTDLSLSELGRMQAQSAVDAIISKGIDIIYSSNLKRAIETAEPAAHALGLEVRATEEFREIYLGEWENIDAQALIDANDPTYCIEFRQRFGFFRAPGGESAQELGDRIYATALKYARMHPGKTILVACHAAAIRMLCARVLGLDAKQVSDELPFPDNASLTTLEFDGEGLHLVKYSESSSEVKKTSAW